jgi:hypothetical protein
MGMFQQTVASVRLTWQGMRDNHDGCPELLDAYERDGLYFGAVRVTVAGEAAAFEFGVEQRGYVSLKQILQTLPFDPLGKHSYFFKGNFSKREPDSDTVSFGVRIEQGANGKGFDFDGPVSLVSNLLWFQSLKDFQAAGALRRLS